MLDKSVLLELMSLADKNIACSEAVDLLDRCLAERSPLLIEQFVQRQMMTNPASIDVLQDLAESVHQHMIALQESLFDIRAAMLNTLKDRFQVEVTPLVPLELIDEYHALELDEALAYVASHYPNVTDEQLVRVCHTMHNAVLRAGQITQSIVLVRQILEYLFDWSEALGINTVQSYWQMARYQPVRSTMIH